MACPLCGERQAMGTEITPPLYEKLIYEDTVKSVQLKVVVNEFKDIQYLHIRKYFLSYEGEWIASHEGVSMPITIDNVTKLTDALLELCSTAEGTDLLNKHFLPKLANSSLEVTD